MLHQFCSLALITTLALFGASAERSSDTLPTEAAPSIVLDSEFIVEDPIPPQPDPCHDLLKAYNAACADLTSAAARLSLAKTRVSQVCPQLPFLCAQALEAQEAAEARYDAARAAKAAALNAYIECILS